ncbi:MAG: cysteine desulfurase [Paludibacteraceae bacterium]|nr:cysteine desulfurase [Paludibacteraceae bacterium]MBQ2607896.1 cysteine desulfurase [Paludibacteraceae bacterium]
MRREEFPILTTQVHGQPLVYLDNAATSQKPQMVVDAIVEGYTHWNSNIHRGTHYLSQQATIRHEQARQQIADFIHASSAREIIFTKGTTDAINMLAFSFGEAFISQGDEIIVSALEHHSNIVPWQMLCERKQATLRVIPLKEDLTLDTEAYASMLNARTRLVSVAHVSNVLGIRQPVEEMIRLAHQQQIPVCIDAAQSVPHMPIDVRQMDCDFLVFSGHKMYGPTGMGVLYGKEAWLNRLPPYQGGGEMIQHVRWEGTTYNELPYKFEAGTPNFIGSYALSKAIEYMTDIGLEKIAKEEGLLAQYAEAQLLEKIPGIKIYAEKQEKIGAISFNMYQEGRLIHPFDIGTLLDQQGVAVRTGHHCAEPLIDSLGVPGTVRVSFGLYNDREDIDRLIRALQRTISMLS